MIQGRAPEEVMRLIQTPEVQGALINPLPAVFPVLGPVVAIASSIANAALLVSMVAKVPSWDRYQVAASAIGTGVAAWVTLDPMTSAQAGLYSGTYGGDVVRAATAPIRWFANNPRLHAFVAKKIASFQRKNP
jgi:microcompartment protein CcmK/EutM